MVLLFSRALPPPVWALLFLWIFLPGMTPGILAIGIHQFGILGKLLWETVENEDARPYNALRTAGVSEGKAFFYAVLPSAFPKFLAYIFYRWEVTTREMVLVGMVGAGGLGRILTESLSSFDYKSVASTLVCLTLIAFLVDFLSRWVRNSLAQSSSATR
ncbi:MAG: ABC transporter permease subunit [Spirochaetia bacterium]|nr:ABC transporter permease subunit [Spirochaetia bacterium]